MQNNTENTMLDRFYTMTLLFDKIIDKYYQIEFSDGVRLLRLSEVCDRLGGLNKSKVIKLYEAGVLKGVRKGNKSVYIFSDSLTEYIVSLKTILHSEYFVNEQNV